MRISDPNGLGHLTTAQNGRAGETEAITPSVKGGSGNSSRATGDRVELSSFSGRLSAELAASSASRAERVARIKAAVQDGSYQTDPAAISRAIVDFSIQAAQR